MTEHTISGFADAPADSIKVLQLSDLHLFAEPDRMLLGVNTEQSFQEVLWRAREKHWPADLLLLTGDLTQDGSREAYQRLRQTLAPLEIPTHWLPGNHDAAAALNETLPGPGLHPARAVYPGNWQIVLLNSAVSGRVEGHLGADELAFLDRELAEHPDRHAMICLHHPPLLVGSRWIDELGLSNPADFFAVVDRHPQVRAIICGHVHQDFSTWRNGVHLWSTPSTCFQFRPGAQDFALDDSPPGYRWLVLRADGSVATGVERLEFSHAGVELDSTGY